MDSGSLDSLDKLEESSFRLGYTKAVAMISILMLGDMRNLEIMRENE